MMNHDVETQGRLLAKLVWGLLKRGTFDDLGDLTEALKRRCVALHIRWTNDDINDAYRLVGSNTRLPGALTAAPPPVERLPEPPILNRREAAALYRALLRRHAPAPSPAMHGAPPYFPNLVRVTW